MKNGKTRRIVTLAALWLTIGAVWIVGLSWPRIIADGADRTVDRSSAGEETQTVIYTLSGELSGPEDADTPDPPPERSVPDPAEPESTEAPEVIPTQDDLMPTDSAPDEEPASPDPSQDPEAVTAPYVLNTHTKKIHLPDCPSVTEMKESNRGFCEDPEEMLAQGYAWCKRCHG